MRRFFILVALLVTPCGVSVASADTPGQSSQFHVNTTYDAQGSQSVDATLRAVGTHGYFYVDDRYWDSLTSSQRTTAAQQLRELADEFDGVIYPRATALWGSEASPGVDGDPHVVVLLERLVSGSGGYFETINNYSRDRTSEGNSREMVFVNVDGVLSGTAARFLAHEFQHLISFNQRELLLRMEEDLWLNEGRSEYTVTAVGYSEPFAGSTLDRRVQTFEREKGDSLTDWPNTTTDYAMASLFVHYLAGRFGPDILSSTMHSPASGTDAVDRWLADRGPERFGDVFTDWMVASYLNDGTENTTYTYTQPGLSSVHVTPVSMGALSGSRDSASYRDNLIEWQPLWVSSIVRSAGDAVSANVHIAGDRDDDWRGAVIAAYSDGQHTVSGFHAIAGNADVPMPVSADGGELSSVVVAVTQGSVAAVGARTIADGDVSVTLTLADTAVAATPNAPTEPAGTLRDGDLIRRAGQQEIYVVWGPYRRYLTTGILELYGFQNRPVTEVSDAVFFGYQASVYIRGVGAKQVFAVWPDGTKHWLNISAAQWDASARDWGAIFTVNEAELAWYAVSRDITQ